jgi:dipicolinate synthase subunit A
LLKDLNILIIGGDRREVDLYLHLKKMGANASLFGFNNFKNLEVVLSDGGLLEQLKIADVIITPLSGIEANGEIYAPFAGDRITINRKEILTAINPEAIFIAGYIHQTLKKIFKENGIRFYETRGMDEISTLNAIPTVEGAIQYAMAHTDKTIHNSQSFVLGFGRCGKILADTLKALGAEVTVVARRWEVLAWVEALKMIPLHLDDLKKEIGKAEVIYNTIPFPILDADVLCNVNKSALIIDIASFPWGVDYAAAERLNIRTILLPGLPGKVAPKTASKILCRVYPPLILSLLKGGGKIGFNGS